MENAVIRFPVAESARSHWVELDPENADLFDRPALSLAIQSQITQEIPGFNGDFLALYLDSDAYRPAYSGESSSIKSGFKSPFMVVGIKTYGFEAEITDFRPAIYFLLKTMQTRAEASLEDCPGVICLDSCAIDDESDLGWGYTVRRGVIAVERTKGLMASEPGEGDLPVSFGIRIIFSSA